MPENQGFARSPRLLQTGQTAATLLNDTAFLDMVRRRSIGA